MGEASLENLSTLKLSDEIGRSAPGWLKIALLITTQKVNIILFIKNYYIYLLILLYYISSMKAKTIKVIFVAIHLKQV